jgi:hypothetical protein
MTVANQLASRTLATAALALVLVAPAFAEERASGLNLTIENDAFSSDDASVDEVEWTWADGSHLASALECLCVSSGAMNEPTSGAISVTIENDAFTGSDDAYSNGVGLTWTSRNVASLSHDNPARAWARAWSALPGVSAPGTERYVSLTLTQEIHTPEDITLESPPLDDRPYAGILYLDSVVYRRSPGMNDAWTLRLGVVGPASHADDTQKWFHDVVDADEPRGWNTQLPNELIFNIGYTADFAGPTGNVSERVRWRVTPMLTAEAGTYATLVGGGAMFEIGYNMPEAAHAVSSLRNGLNAASVVGWREDERELSIVGNIGVAGYSVARFLPLDGTYFRDSRSADYGRTIGVVSAGATVRYGDYALNLNLAFSESSINGREDTVEFGALTLSRRFP